MAIKLPNRNQILIAIGLLSVMGPDIDAAGRWLTASGIPHVTGVVHLLGLLSAVLGGLALAWPKIRPFLATLGLTTPPGAVAPWVPGRAGDPELAAPVDLPSSEAPTPIRGTPLVKPRDPSKGSIEWWVIISVLAIGALACASIVAFAPHP